MTKHLIVFYGRTGSTLVDHHVSRNLCKPVFEFWNNGFESSEIHPDEYQMYYDKLFPLQIEWAMKYHVMTGTHVTLIPRKDYKVNLEDYIVNLDDTDKFFKDLKVTDLHFSFRIDCMDTICSHMIAELDNTWVVTDNEVKKHEKRYIDPQYIRKTCDAFNLSYKIYNEYVKRYKNNYNIEYYPYERLYTKIDIDNDPRGMKKQLTKVEKQNLIENYDEVEDIAKLYPFYHGTINEKNGILEV